MTNHALQVAQFFSFVLSFRLFIVNLHLIHIDDTKDEYRQKDT